MCMNIYRVHICVWTSYILVYVSFIYTEIIINLSIPFHCHCHYVTTSDCLSVCVFVCVNRIRSGTLLIVRVCRDTVLPDRAINPI